MQIHAQQMMEASQKDRLAIVVQFALAIAYDSTQNYLYQFVVMRIAQSCPQPTWVCD